MSGRFGDLSPEQESALAEFRSKLPAGTEVDDHTCLRFLRSRKFDVEKAADLYSKDIKWRAENKIDEMLNGPPMPPGRMEQLATIVACSHHGFDKCGRPLYIEKTGMIPVDGMLSYFTDAEMLHAHIWGNEYSAMRAKQGSLRVGKTVDTFASILDLKGLTSSHKKLLDYAKLMTAVDQDHYPERLGFMCVINCPWYFPMFWSIVSAWIDPVTRAKFIILGSDYQEKLLELIDADQLPVEYGGTCDGSQCGTAVGKPAGTPCIKLHDQAEAMKAFEVDESTLDMKEQVVPSGTKHEVLVAGEAGTVFSWYIKTTSHDIEVAVDFFANAADAAANAGGSASAANAGAAASPAAVAPQIVVANKRFPTGEIPVQGSFQCKVAGALKFVFDNSYSYWTSKTCRFHITSTPPA